MKKYIIGLVTGLLISGTVVYAANYLYSSNEVSYTPGDSNWNVGNVKEALDNLKSTSGTALTDLKNTSIAKAISANGNSLSSVINTLGTITNQGNKSFTVDGTNSITIPAGYYNGQGTISTSGLILTPTATLTLSDVTSGTDVTNYKTVKTSGLMKTPTGSKNITANGSNIDVKNYATVNVNVPINVSSVTAGSKVKATSFSVSTTAGAGTYIVIGHLTQNSSASGATNVSSYTATNGTLTVIDNRELNATSLGCTGRIIVLKLVCTANSTITINSSKAFESQAIAFKIL